MRFVLAIFLMLFCGMMGPLQGNDLPKSTPELLALSRSFQAHSVSVSFSYPEDWKCLQQETNWACRSNQSGPDVAMIVVTLKKEEKVLTLPEYQQKLNQKKVNPGAVASLVSVPVSSEIKNISGQQWVDATHFNGEFKDFHTRYLLTVKDNEIILVSFSVHQLKYDTYQPQFERMVQSLKVISDISKV